MSIFSRRKIISRLLSLGELDDRSQFKTAGAIAQIDKKFTRKEGKPFAVVWIEDLSGTLEVVDLE